MTVTPSQLLYRGNITEEEMLALALKEAAILEEQPLGKKVTLPRICQVILLTIIVFFFLFMLYTTRCLTVCFILVFNRGAKFWGVQLDNNDCSRGGYFAPLRVGEGSCRCFIFLPPSPNSVSPTEPILGFLSQRSHVTTLLLMAQVIWAPLLIVS